MVGLITEDLVDDVLVGVVLRVQNDVLSTFATINTSRQPSIVRSFLQQRQILLVQESTGDGRNFLLTEFLLHRNVHTCVKAA